MDAAYGARYRELYTCHWWWRAREAFLVETLRRLLPEGRRATILDVGCGDGLFFDRLAEFGEVDGVESDQALISPDGPHRARIHVGPFDASFVPTRTYSLVLMLDVLEHLSDPASALRRAREVMAPEGLLVATVPAFPLLWTQHDVVNHHRRRYTKRIVAALVSDAGLALREMRYFFHWTFPAKLLVRLHERLREDPPRPPQLPPRWLNRALYGLSRIEQRVRLTARLPFGSSLLVVASAPSAKRA